MPSALPRLVVLCNQEFKDHVEDISKELNIPMTTLVRMCIKYALKDDATIREVRLNGDPVFVPKKKRK